MTTITPNPILEFSIPRVTGAEFTAQRTGPRPINGGGDLYVGHVRWGDISINGKHYDSDSARIIYDYNPLTKKRVFNVDLGFNAYSKYTDSARDILTAGIYNALDGAGLLDPPTLEDIHAELLEAAYQAGHAYGAGFDSAISDGFDRLISDWYNAYDVLTGKSHNNRYSLPDVDGAPTLDELKAEFLAAAQAAIAEHLAKVEARIN